MKMSGGRIFTDEELQAMTNNELDQLAKNLNGNEKAQELLKTIEGLNDGMRVAYMDFTAAVLGYIQDSMGSDAFEESVRRYGEVFMKPLYLQSHSTDDWMKSWKEEPNMKTFKNLIMEIAATIRVQSGRGFKKVEEDDEKITMRVAPCGSGGRMRRSGHYGPPYNFPRVKGPHHLTFGHSDFPHYCQHCAILYARMPIEMDGALWPVIEPDETDQGQCTFYFYKDPKDIPEEYYTRVGKKKVIK
jgi:hypothetical protein